MFRVLLDLLSIESLGDFFWYLLVPLVLHTLLNSSVDWRLSCALYLAVVIKTLLDET